MTTWYQSRTFLSDRDAALFQGLQALEARSLAFEEKFKEMADRACMNIDRIFDKAISALKSKRELHGEELEEEEESPKLEEEEEGQRCNEGNSVTTKLSAGKAEEVNKKMQLESGKKEVACPDKYGGGLGGGGLGGLHSGVITEKSVMEECDKAGGLGRSGGYKGESGGNQEIIAGGGYVGSGYVGSKEDVRKQVGSGGREGEGKEAGCGSGVGGVERMEKGVSSGGQGGKAEFERGGAGCSGSGGGPGGCGSGQGCWVKNGFLGGDESCGGKFDDGALASGGRKGVRDGRAKAYSNASGSGGGLGFVAATFTIGGGNTTCGGLKREGNRFERGGSEASGSGGGPGGVCGGCFREAAAAGENRGDGNTCGSGGGVGVCGGFLQGGGHNGHGGGSRRVNERGGAGNSGLGGSLTDFPGSGSAGGTSDLVDGSRNGDEGKRIIEGEGSKSRGLTEVFAGLQRKQVFEGGIKGSLVNVFQYDISSMVSHFQTCDFLLFPYEPNVNQLKEATVGHGLTDIGPIFLPFVSKPNINTTLFTTQPNFPSPIAEPYLPTPHSTYQPSPEANEIIQHINPTFTITNPTVTAKPFPYSSDPLPLNLKSKTSNSTQTPSLYNHFHCFISTPLIGFCDFTEEEKHFKTKQCPCLDCGCQCNVRHSCQSRESNANYYPP